MNYKHADALQSLILVLCFEFVQNEPRLLNPDLNDPNSDVNLDSLQLIAKYANTSEKHPVVTEDGYIVNTFRIPKKGPPVLMVHGIGDSSDSWVVTSPSHSLAFQLAELGYDIWLYNARGNKYSKEHMKQLPKKEYWNFSYEEMGYLDLPAVIDYILSTRNQTKLYYVGFSQGTTLFFIMGSLRPEYNEKVKQAVLLAPVAWLDNIKYPYMDFFAKNMNLFKFILESFGSYGGLFQNSSILKLFHGQICRENVPEFVFCQLEYALSYGINNITHLNLKQLPAIASHIPAGVSLRTFEHFFQTYLSKRFQRFDFGPEGNYQKYSSSQCPEFDVSLITTPVHLFASDNDWYSTMLDVDKLRDNLPNIVSFTFFNKSVDFTHLEFIYGERTKSLVNDPVINILLNDVY